MCSYNSAIWRPVKQTRHGWYISFASLWLNSFHLESTQFTCVFWDFIYLFIFIFLCFPDAYLIVLRSYTIYLNCVFPSFLFLFFGYPFCSMRLISLHLESAQFSCIFLKFFIYFLPPWGLFDYTRIWIFFPWFLKKNIWFASIGKFFIY